MPPKLQITETTLIEWSYTAPLATSYPATSPIVTTAVPSSAPPGVWNNTSPCWQAGRPPGVWDISGSVQSADDMNSTAHLPPVVVAIGTNYGPADPLPAIVAFPKSWLRGTNYGPAAPVPAIVAFPKSRLRSRLTHLRPASSRSRPEALSGAMSSVDEENVCCNQPHTLLNTLILQHRIWPYTQFRACNRPSSRPVWTAITPRFTMLVVFGICTIFRDEELTHAFSDELACFTNDM